MNAVKLLMNIGAVKSNSEARRLIEQGGLCAYGDPIFDMNFEFMEYPVTVHVGRQQFLVKEEPTNLEL